MEFCFTLIYFSIQLFYKWTATLIRMRGYADCWAFAVRICPEGTLCRSASHTIRR